MAKVDPYDDSIKRYAIKRHAYDLEKKHFRWIFESAYDKKREFKRHLQAAFDELESRRQKGEAHVKEQVAGQILEIGYFRNSKSRRQAREEEGQLFIASPRNKAIFFISRTYPISRSRRLNKLLRRFLSK